MQRRHSAKRYQNQPGRFRTARTSRFPTCTHEDSPFHPLSLRPQLMASSHLQGMVIVSVPGPGLSPDILYRCSCVRSGGETFLRPEGPEAVQPLSHVVDFWLYLFFKPIYIYGMIFLQVKMNLNELPIRVFCQLPINFSASFGLLSSGSDGVTSFICSISFLCAGYVPKY